MAGKISGEWAMATTKAPGGICSERPRRKSGATGAVHAAAAPSRTTPPLRIGLPVEEVIDSARNSFLPGPEVHSPIVPPTGLSGRSFSQSICQPSGSPISSGQIFADTKHDHPLAGLRDSVEFHRDDEFTQFEILEQAVMHN